MPSRAVHVGEPREGLCFRGESCPHEIGTDWIRACLPTVFYWKGIHLSHDRSQLSHLKG